MATMKKALCTALCCGTLISGVAGNARTHGIVQWPFYGGDQEGTKYSELQDINKKNVSDLRIAWTWKTGETALSQYGTSPGMFEVTPLMIDDVLYFEHSL